MSKKVNKRLRRIRFIILCIIFILGILTLFGKWTTISEKENSKEKEYAKEKIIKEKAEKEKKSDKDDEENQVKNSDKKIEKNKSKDHEESKKVSYSTHVSVPSEEAYLKDGRKMAFLTFDDGPSKNTIKILKILNQKNVKATFFVLGQLAEKNDNIIRDIYDNGHSIGNHTYSHNYSKIYSNVNILLNEIDRTDNILKEILGEDFNSKLFRFPGGSFGEKKSPFRTAVLNNGYKYIDWNALNRDSEKKRFSVNELIENIKDTVEGKEKAVILMHDAPTKTSTVEMLPDVIDYLKSEGYEFGVLE
ncbi:polysaccharide deacetylase [Clostridium sp. D2Q-14]|uniref:polysaccharide deacetylase family protein n=1 Tax=Anaeromonas gelatinilytica TaxID=2683194 RepID=UPI00193B0FAB|nr:polysaccharide deacetylase family protein [Anaeromonas gelatinilytica]MBS4534093.1 polysaccharide deacetylase [Anaeromonas gelatinilytica]